MKNILRYSCLGLGLLMVNTPDLLAQSSDIEEIAVTGTRIRGANPAGFSPVTIINQEQIQISGEMSIGELLKSFLRKVPETTETGTMVAAGQSE